MAHSGDLTKRGVKGMWLLLSVCGTWSKNINKISCLLAVGDVSLDLDALMETKKSAVKSLTGGIAMLFKSNKVMT